MSSAVARARKNVASFAAFDPFVATQDIPNGTTGENAVANGVITPT